MHRDSEHAQGLLVSSRHINILPLVLSIFMSFLHGSQSNMVTDCVKFPWDSTTEERIQQKNRHSHQRNCMNLIMSTKQ